MNYEPLLAHIRESEGFRSEPYHCPAGRLTVGYGTMIEHISRDEAEWLLRHRLEVAIEEIRKRWPWTDDLSETRRAALYDMAYNMGVPTLAQFRNSSAPCRPATSPKPQPRPKTADGTAKSGTALTASWT
jgi:lysozyme